MNWSEIKTVLSLVKPKLLVFATLLLIVSLVLKFLGWSALSMAGYLDFFAAVFFILALLTFFSHILTIVEAPLRGAGSALLIGILYLIFIVQDQGIETIRALHQETTIRQVVDYFVWTLLTMYLAESLYYTAYIGLKITPPDDEQPFLPGLNGSPPKQIRHIIVLSLVNGIPWAANAIGELMAGPSWLPFSIFLLFLWGTILKPHLNIRDVTRSSDAQMILLSIFGLTAFAFAVIIVLGFFNIPFDFPSPAFLAGWGILLAGILALFRGASYRYFGLTALVLIALILSYFNLSDNHELPFARTERVPPRVGSAFASWLDHRGPGNEPFTVFIVASEGGGARASYMTALVLEEMRIRCYDFQHHLFAVVAVSGGSVGAVLSAAAAKLNPYPSNRGCLLESPKMLSEASPAVKTAGTDLLRPLLRGAFLLDPIMRFLPGSLLNSHGTATSHGLNSNFFQRWTDRSSYLDWRLDLAWPVQKQLPKTSDHIQNSATQSQRLGNLLFQESWPGPAGDVPALILLATDVGSGRRVAVSHLHFGTEELPKAVSAATVCASPMDEANKALDERVRLLTVAEIAPGRDLTLLDAAFVSARFPIVTPSATLPCPDPGWRLVDGGYYENSGLTTTLEIADAIAAETKNRRIRIVVVRIENGSAAANRANQEGAVPKPPATSFSEVMSPLRAFYGTREARADQARYTIKRAIERRFYGRECNYFTKERCVEIAEVRMRLRPCHVPVPLGWSLSEGARAEIRQQLGLEEVSGSSPECVKGIARENEASFKELSMYATGQK